MGLKWAILSVNGFKAGHKKSHYSVKYRFGVLIRSICDHNGVNILLNGHKLCKTDVTKWAIYMGFYFNIVTKYPDG